ncbi:MAG: tetratricopeptide repeat protein [Bacteroidia bacterium]|nr:tetratricopeptide repeat protein [Bacteroidia bacterium]
MRSLNIYFFALIFCLLPFLGAAQPNIDSLKQVISTAKSDTIRIKTYNRLAIIYSRNDADLAKLYADSALNEINNSDKKAGNIKFYEMERSRVFSIKGHLAFRLGNSEESVEYCIKALKISEKFNENKNTAKLLSNLGATLGKIGNNTEAKFYYTKASKMRELIYRDENKSKRSKMDLASSYINLGGVFIELENSDSSLFYLKKALVLLDTNEKSDPLGLCYMYLGGSYLQIKNYPQAIKYTQKAIDLYLALGIPEKISSCYASLSGTYFESKKYQKALYYLNIAEKINKKNSLNNDLLDSYQNKAQVYEKLGDIKHEILYLKKHAHLKDSLLAENHNEQIIELQTQYETEKKEKEILRLNKDNKIQELELEKEAATKKRLTIIIISVVLVLLILSILTVFLMRTISERKKAYLKLQEKNIEIENQSEALSWQAKQITRYQSQMNPHFMFNALNTIQGFVITGKKEKTIDQINSFSDLMYNTLNNSIKESLRLADEIKYLDSYLKFEQARFLNKIDLIININNVDDYELSIPPMLIQPFIENTLKHGGLQNIANAQISISFLKEGNYLKVIIADNGIGFNSDTDIFKRSHAIAMLRTRIKLIFVTAGSEIVPDYFEIISKPKIENGTIVKFYLPLILKK